MYQAFNASVGGLKLLVYEALTMRPQATSVSGLKLLLHAALRYYTAGFLYALLLYDLHTRGLASSISLVICKLEVYLAAAAGLFLRSFAASP